MLYQVQTYAMVDTVSSGSYGDPATRRRILDVGLRLASELGPSMRLIDVARDAGVSHQGLYLHFGGRDGLLLALLPHMIESFDLHRRYEEVTGAADGREALVRMVSFLATMNARLDTIGWVLEEAQHLDEEFGRDWKQRVTGVRGVIERDVVDRLASEGLLRSEWTTSDATDLIVALTTLGSWRELTRELGWNVDEYCSNVVRILETSLLGEGA